MADLFADATSQETTDSTTVDTSNQAVDTSVQSTDTSTQTTDANTSQNTEENWINSIVPEEYREAGWINRHANKDEFFKSMLNLNQLIGKKLIPNESDPQALNEFRERMGIPKEASEYKIELPEGFTADEESLKAFKELAHKGNIPPDVANDLYNQGLSEVKKSIELYEQSKEAEIDKAFQDFAQQPNFKEVSVNVTNLLKKVDPTGEVLSQEDINELGVNAPKVANFLNKIAEMTGDDKIIGIKDGVGLATGSREEQINQVMRDYQAKRIDLRTADARREAINKSYGYAS